MEGIRGNHSFTIDAAALAERLAAHQDILIDIGTGDGRYVRHVARTCPPCFAIGVDACRENLRDVSRTSPDNALYLIASAQALPRELYGLATRFTINFPWGSLMSGLLDGDPALLDGLGAIARPGAALDVRLNGVALEAAGWSLERGGEQARRMLRDGGFVVAPPQPLSAQALRACPTTWAKRLAFGRDPRALYLRARRPDARRSRSDQPLVAARSFAEFT